MSNFYPKTVKQWKIHKRFQTDECFQDQNMTYRKGQSPMASIIHKINFSEHTTPRNLYKNISKDSDTTCRIQSEAKMAEIKFVEVPQKLKVRSKGGNPKVRGNRKQPIMILDNMKMSTIGSRMWALERNFLKNYATAKRQLKLNRRSLKGKKRGKEDSEQQNQLKTYMSISTPQCYNTLRNSQQEALAKWKQDYIKKQQQYKNSEGPPEPFQPYRQQSAPKNRNKQSISEKFILAETPEIKFMNLKKISLKPRLSNDREKHEKKRQLIQYWKGRRDSKGRYLVINSQRMDRTGNLIQISPWQVPNRESC